MTDDETSFAMCLDSLIDEAGIYDLWSPITQGPDGEAEIPFVIASDWVTFETIYEQEKPRRFRKMDIRQHLELRGWDTELDGLAAEVKARVSAGGEALKLVRKVAFHRWEQCEAQRAKLGVRIDAIKAAGRAA